VVGIMLIACAPLFAQQITGSVRGTVADSSGALVAGATVTARQLETGLGRTATTDRSGNYLLLELPVVTTLSRSRPRAFRNTCRKVSL
jgi:hypothetical protein